MCHPLNRQTRSLIISLLTVLVLFASPEPLTVGALPQSTPGNNSGQILPLDKFSPAFLGIFRKMMVIEDEILKYATKYSVDIDLVRAVCMYESGGNANLNSWAGARGYFQVMPATFRSLQVPTNIEAGIKYLSQMIERFDREDYALAAYNGGPGRVSRGRPPLESLQYVLGVGAYRSILKLYEPSIRHHASRIGLEEVRHGDDWWTIGQRLGMSVFQLRLYNPFLVTRTLREGQLMAYPPKARINLLTRAGNDLEYRTRHGDNYLHLAFIFDVDIDILRDANDLWRIQTLPANQLLRIPLSWNTTFNQHPVEPGDTLRTVAEAYKSTPWRIVRDNNLFWDDQLSPGMTLRIRPAPPAPTYLTHRVSSGDTLGLLATKYRTSVRAIQVANNMGQNTLIRIGQRLRIPTPTDR